MKIYYERMMLCDCGFSARQTTEKPTLNRIGKLLANQEEHSFKRHPVKWDLSFKHRCSRNVRYTEWLARW